MRRGLGFRGMKTGNACLYMRDEIATEPQRPGEASNSILSAFIVIVFIIGLIASVRWIWHFLAGLHIQVSSFSLPQFWGYIKAFFRENEATWAAIVTAVATYYLYRATSALSRSTNLQQVVDGPFLRIDLKYEPPLTQAVRPGSEFEAENASEIASYWDRWDNQDRTDPNIGSFLSNTEPRYVYLTVANTQTKPHGLAQRIVLKTSLDFEPSLGQPKYSYARVVEIPVIGAGDYTTVALFDIGGIPQFFVTVADVEYQDITGRSRRSAFGDASLNYNVKEVPVLKAAFYAPRKGEFTDAIRQ